MKRVALHLTEATEIVIHVGHGAATMTQREEDTPLPERPIPPIPAKRLSPCMRAIVVTLCETGRLTQAKLLAAMEARGRLYSDSAVRHALAELVKIGFLANDPKATPPGYDVIIDDAEQVGGA
jgi:hypothetical protein